LRFGGEYHGKYSNRRIAVVSCARSVVHLVGDGSVPRFRRTFTLSRELDTGRIEANLKDGVLTLRVPKQAHAQPRRIEVSAA
jgi:HSP20 family protein